MGRTLAQQAIEESIIEESEERARRGGSRTLAEHALDQSADELRRKQGAQSMTDEHGPDIPDTRAPLSRPGGKDTLANLDREIGGLLARRSGNGSSPASSAGPERRYLPTLADLIDRLTIVQQKMIFIPERRAEYIAERAAILHDIDVILAETPKLNARAVMAITMIQLTNRYIWENEAKARSGGSEQDKLLKLTHSINGSRNTAKNILSEIVGGRKDYKVDCFAADLIEAYGNWNVFDAPAD